MKLSEILRKKRDEEKDLYTQQAEENNRALDEMRKYQRSLSYWTDQRAIDLARFNRRVAPIVQSTWNNIQNQTNDFLNRTKTYFSNTKKSPEPMQAQNTSTWNKVQSVSQNAPTVQPSANMTVPTTKGMEEKRNEQVKQQQEKSKDFKETIRQNSHIATQEEIANTQVTSPEAYLKAQEYAKKAEKGDYSFLFEKAGDEILSGGQNALGGIVQGFAGLGQMATRALGADNATNALMNFSDEMLTKQNRAGETRQLLKQNLERTGRGGFLNDVLNVGGNLVESVSNTVISGAFGGGSGSTFGMGLSAGGNAFAKRQKESNGQNYARNVIASSLEGVWNSVWEKATGGNLLTRKTSINDAGEVIAENTGWLDKFALEKIAKYAKNPATINAVNKVWQQLGEVVEEVGTDLFSAITNDIVAKENFEENFNWAQEKETAFYTVLSTLVLSKIGLGGMEAQDLADQYGLSLEQVQQVEKEVNSFMKEHNVKTDEKTVGKIIDGLMDKNGLDTKTLDIDNTLQEIYDENIQGKATPSPKSEEYKTNIQSIINNIPMPDDVKAQIQPFLNSNATMNENQYNSLKDTLKKYVEADTQRQYDDLKNNVSAQYDQIDAQIEQLDEIKPENFQDAESRKYYAQQMGKEFDTSTFEQLLATYPENRNGKRTVKAYKEIAKAYGQQMALNGLSFDEVRANTVGAWQQYEPNKNITRYDNKEHKNQGFDRLNSQVWSQEVYDSYKETMTNQLNQQKQNIMNDYQTQFQEIEDNGKAYLDAIDKLGQQETTQATKSESQVNQEVADYIERNNLNMTVDQFIQWASTKELENETNMSPEQQELYSLISDIQNRSNQNKLENGNELEYNKVSRKKEQSNYIYRKITNQDKARVESDYKTNPKKYGNEGTVDFSDATYGYIKIGDEIIVTNKARGSQKFINKAKGEWYGINELSKGTNKVNESIRNERRGSNEANTVRGETQGSREGDRQVTGLRGQGERINQGNVNENNSNNLESQQGSFNLPKNKEIAHKEANLPISQETTSVPLNNQKQRRAYKSIIESEMMSDEAKAIAKKFIGQDTYTPDSNAQQLKRADDRIQRNGVEKELDTLETNAMEGKTIKADDIAVGDRLIQYYSKVGDLENLQRAIRATAMAGTQAGRSVQAFALLRHQTPEGMAIWIQNSVDKLNSKTKNGQFDFTQEMQEKILNSTEDNLQQNVDEVMKELGQQVPKDILSKLDAWRYFSMLANPKTHIRNIVGNFAMGLTQRVSNKVAGTIEQVTGRDRTKTSIFERRSKANIEFAKNDLKNVSSQLGIGTSKYSNPQNAIQQNQRTFKSDALEKSLGRMFNLNDNLLEAEDNFGLKNAYVRNLSDYMSANKLNPNTITNEQLQKARAIAIDKALEATFHQASNLASVLNQLENKNIGTRLILGGLVPFKKTPINVAKAGAEYSPAGLAKSLIYDTVQLRKGNINTNQWIDNISKGLTGTGIAVLGYALAKAGILKAGGDDDKEDKYKQAMGEQPYAVTINGKSYSLDWLAPSGIPLFVGAELARIVDDKTEKDGETENEALKAIGRVADATSSLLNPMSEMSMISGITSTIQSFSQDSGQALMNLVVSPLKSYVGQTVPTALGQVARTMDTYERDTSSTETGLLPKAIDQTKNQIMNKIPGLRQMLPTKKDIWGEEVETQDYFHNAVLPYTEKEIKSNPVDKELNSLYEKTGEKIYPNTSLDKEVKYDNSKIRLTNQDYNEFKENYGKTSYRLLNDLTSSKDYKSMTDEEKVKAIKEVYSYANHLNKYNYAQKKGIEFETPTDVQAVNAIKQNGGTEADYFKYKGLTDGMNNNSEKISAIKDSNLSSRSKKALYNATVGKNDKFYQNTDIDINEYLGYKASGVSKKADTLEYVNQNISGYENRLLIMAKDFKLTRSQQRDLANYINTLSNADDIYSMLSNNFTITEDGKVYYK